MTFLLLSLTIGIFYLSRRLQQRAAWEWFNPILITIALLIFILHFAGLSYEEYEESGQFIDFWLKPAVVALGVPLYLQLQQIRKLWLPILISQLVGCIVGIVSVVCIAQTLGASHIVVLSLASKSVTTPIAMEVTKSVGGIPSLTAAVVVITGLLGAIIGFKTFDIGHIKSPIAKGLSMGTASHAVGTSAAMQQGAKYGAFASLGITLNGLFTAILTPSVLYWMGILC